jgi:hypothetical protein
MTAQEIKIIVEQLGSLAAVIRDADPADKTPVSRRTRRPKSLLVVILTTAES